MKMKRVRGSTWYFNGMTFVGALGTSMSDAPVARIATGGVPEATMSVFVVIFPLFD